MHRMSIVAPLEVVAFDLAVPTEVFERARAANGSLGYEVTVCGPERRLDAGGYAIELRAGLEALEGAETVVVAGTRRVDEPQPEPLLAALRAAHARGARMASICSGAFVLAQAGLLDGRRATTHWMAAGQLQARHPRVRVDAAVLFVDEGDVLTSAGAAAALDLCLYIVGEDLGAAAAAEAARMSVMPLGRPGGQAQFVRLPSPEPGELAGLIPWLEAHCHEPLDLDALAARASMSPRTLHRRFRNQTGQSPMQWLVGARLRRAQVLLETSEMGIEQIADAVGFHSATVLREHFRRRLGTSPTAYRRAFVGAGRPERGLYSEARSSAAFIGVENIGKS